MRYEYSFNENGKQIGLEQIVDRSDSMWSL